MPSICLILGIIYGFMRYERKIARLTQSPALAGDAKGYKTDLYTGVVILANFIGGFLNVHLDRIASFIIAGFIFKAGGVLFLNAIKILLASLDFAVLDKVKSIVLEESRVGELKSLTGRSSGNYKFYKNNNRLNAITAIPNTKPKIAVCPFPYFLAVGRSSSKEV